MRQSGKESRVTGRTRSGWNHLGRCQNRGMTRPSTNRTSPSTELEPKEQSNPWFSPHTHVQNGTGAVKGGRCSGTQVGLTRPWRSASFTHTTCPVPFIPPAKQLIHRASHGFLLLDRWFCLSALRWECDSCYLDTSRPQVGPQQWCRRPHLDLCQTAETLKSRLNLQEAQHGTDR